MNTHIIIPARLASSRFPEKILANINGKTLMQHTYEQAVKSNLGPVIIAVDNLKVKEVAEAFGAQTCMTDLSHISGTSRLSEVCEQLKLPPEDFVLNWQVDEPVLNIKNAEQVVNLLKSNSSCEVATLCEEIKHFEELKNTNITKVVLNHFGQALYFSRAMIPWDRSWVCANGRIQDSPLHLKNHFRHLGLYAYKVNFLLSYKNMPECVLEKLEGLEQLRFLYAGYKIAVELAKENSMAGVDTPDDLQRLITYLSNR